MGHEVDAHYDAYEDGLLVEAVGGAYGRGGEQGARLLKNKNVLEIKLELGLPPDQVKARAFEAIGKTAHVLEGPGADEGDVRVIGIVGSGAMNMNPTVVMVTISDLPSGSKVTVRGAAKEGLLFKQRAGEKAAKRVAEALA
jgi:hypothetical protein